MTDWTDVIPAPFGVSYFSSYNGIHSIGAATGSLGSPASAAYVSALRAVYIPFRLMTPTRITKLWALSGATFTGNIDLGIYDVSGVRLASTGSTIHSGTNAMQIISLATAIRLGVGQFYMAVAMDNTTGTLFRSSLSISNCKAVGMAQQASAFALPATATFATISSAYLPVVGFISEEG